MSLAAVLTQGIDAEDDFAFGIRSTPGAEEREQEREHQTLCLRAIHYPAG